MGIEYLVVVIVFFVIGWLVGLSIGDPGGWIFCLVLFTVIGLIFGDDIVRMFS